MLQCKLCRKLLYCMTREEKNSVHSYCNVKKRTNYTTESSKKVVPRERELLLDSKEWYSPRADTYLRNVMLIVRQCTVAGHLHALRLTGDATPLIAIVRNVWIWGRARFWAQVYLRQLAAGF